MDNSYSENAAESLGGPSFRIPPSLKAKYQHGNSPLKVTKVRNLSRGGLCIEDGVSHTVGTSLRIFLKIRDKKMEVQGEVIWNIQEKESLFVYGIKFTFLSHEAQEWFNTFVMDWAAEHLAENLDFSSLTTPTQAERRMFARLKIPLRVEVGYNPDTILIQTHIYDISEGGLCLISNLELKKDQDVYLKLWFDERKFVLLTGNIKYCAKKTIEKRQVNFHGVEFHQIESVKEVARFLEAKRSELDMIELTLDEIISQTDFPKLP